MNISSPDCRTDCTLTQSTFGKPERRKKEAVLWLLQKQTTFRKVPRAEALICATVFFVFNCPKWKPYSFKVFKYVGNVALNGMHWTVIILFFCNSLKVFISVIISLENISFNTQGTYKFFISTFWISLDFYL